MSEILYQNTAQFYDLFGDSSHETARRANFLSSLLRDGPARVIDAGAGTGDIAFRLAKMGHELFCFESSSSMHTILLDRLKAQRDLHTRFSAFPIRVEELNADLGVNLAFALNVFSHLSREGRVSLLKGLRRHVHPNGLLVFNCAQYHPDRTDQPLEKIGEKVIGDVTYRHFASSEGIDLSRRKITFKFEVARSDQLLKLFEEEFILYLDSPEEIDELLSSAGFRKIELYGNYEKAPYRGLSPGFVVVAAPSHD